uniref:Uncharacterized protein n=1 Tax=Periophthalmus magnuspinnatus TaxID=409849 RepID=A0A3B4BG52_9GOBI
YETFDGIYFYFPGTLWINTGFPVRVHNSRVCEGSVYSCPRALSLFFPNEEEIHISGYQVHQGGRRLPHTIGGVFIERLADYLLVKSVFGFSLAWDGESGVYLKMSEDHQGVPCGLCGNFNHLSGDDLTTARGKTGLHYLKLPDTPYNYIYYTIAKDKSIVPSLMWAGGVDAIEKCSALLFFPFLSCHQHIDPNPFVASCVSDLCVSDDEDTFCKALVEYTRACSHVGYPVREWRDSFPSCNDGCEDSFVYRDCISCCPPTCTFEKECLGTNLHCLDGCYCPDGLILQNGTCIAVSQCPCVYHGTSYGQGHVLPQGCSVCVCMGGVWNCTENNCTAECSVVGDVFVTTFDGRMFLQPGACQYVLAKSRTSNKFIVTLQYTTCIKYDFKFWMSVTLVLDEDMTRQITLTREGEVIFGRHHTLIYKTKYCMINALTTVFTLLKTDIGLQILYDGQGGRIYLQIENYWRGLTLGLCGTFNGNLRDDFLSPSGMIEGTPQLHSNAWKVSSACIAPVTELICVIHFIVYYANQCEILVGSVFAPCHGYISPNVYQQQCRYQACRCGGSCLCTVLAHYAYLCSKHGADINFRPHVLFLCAGVVCLGGMLYHSCVSSCGRSCRALFGPETCDPAECAEGCGCPHNSYYDDVRQQSDSTEVGECPEGKVYHSCNEQRGGVACAPTCRNLMLNMTCPPNTPCIPGCVCPPGLVLHHGECYYPENCPCAWLGLEYLPGETVETPCYRCVCHRGYFNCSYSPCPAVCTVYSDRHYHTFDGLEYDYHSDCQVYLIKSTEETEVSIIAQNKDCYESGIVCLKTLVIHVGLTQIYFTDNSGNPSPSTVIGRGFEFELWKAGYYTVVHFANQDLTILWDRKTTVHIRAGPQWKGHLSGMCGNFDSVTVNDMTTSSHMEVNNAQTFGDSWALGQVGNTTNFLFPPCFRECALLYSDVFAPCHNVVDVAWFYRNCLTDTCNCNRGGDCECLCTSIAAYAHKCCQQGVTIHWRSPSACRKSNCTDLYLLHRQTVSPFSAAVRTGQMPAPGLLFNFMITAGLQKDKTSRVPAVSLESAERPNYFLVVSSHSSLHLERWTRGPEFSRRATFIQHQGLFLPGHSSFELMSQPGTFLTLTRAAAQAQRYDSSEGFKAKSSFVIPYRMMCEWRYQPCASPCVHTCSDPDATRCQFLPPVEGCFPRCPQNMVLDEVTRRCVYTEDCNLHGIHIALFTAIGVMLPPTPTPFAYVTRSNRTTTQPTTTTMVTTTTRPTTTTTITTTTTTEATTTPLTSTAAPTTTTTATTTTASTTLSPTTTTTPLPTTPTTTLATEMVTTPTTSLPTTSLPTTITTTPALPPTTTTTPLPTTTPEATTTEMIITLATTIAITTTTTVPTTTTEATTLPPTTTPTITTTAFITTPTLTPSPVITTEQTTTATTSTPSTTPTTMPPTTTIHSTPVYTTESTTLLPETTTAETTPPMETSTSTMTTTATPPTTSEPTTEPTTEPFTTEIVTSPTVVTEEPPYSYRIDECAELICFNGELLLHNSSLHCRYNTTQPQCNLLGLPVLTSSDPCCPQWQCPCRCTVMSDLRVITFDGNNVALYDNGSYILVKLPRETIIGTVEKCPTSQGPTGASGLCFKKLNITTSSYRIIINRLDRKVTVNYRPVRLPFSRHSLYVEDTGSMYLLHTPGGISIQWYHSTGIMVLQYMSPTNGSVPTRGLCGCCDGHPEDDLKLPNGTVVREVGDMVVFLHAWRVQTTDETEHTRRVGDNCTIGDCSTCISMLQQRTFVPCHSKVPPEQFCDIIWAGDLHYKNHQCDFLAAYVAVCYTHQVCINWRRPNFCPLRCPPGKEYQPCVSTCTSRTCLNKDYYEETTCSFIREECVCRPGTILHRADSPFCVTEDRCVCTDNEGNPRAPGEVWNGSVRGCCLYKCMENGSVVSVEPDCDSVPTPLCERDGEYVLDVLEEGACCPKKICECNMTICDNDAPPCDNGNRLVMGYSATSCCPEYRCECDPMACPPVSSPECREDQFLVEVRGSRSCCYSYLCVCESCIEPIPSCSNGEILAVDLNTTNSCCPRYHCVCDVNLCTESSITCAPGLSLITATVPGHCCPQYHCGTHWLCILHYPIYTHTHIYIYIYILWKADVCLFQGVTVLGPGQSLVQYFEGEMCYTVHCLHRKDPDTGFYAMEISSVNCSQKCGPHQIYVPSTDPQVCCGSCKNISCTFTNENGTTELFAAGSSWVENCTRFDCMETSVGAVVLASGVICPPFNDTECVQNGGVVQSYVDGCCRTCKEDGKTCKRVAIRTTIRKDDCRSNAPVTVYSCDGKCPSATIFNFNINSHARFCKCCRESGLQTRSVTLYCSRNATVVEYTFQEPLDCSCQWN